MLKSFIQADVYRIMLGCNNRQTLIEAIDQNGIMHDGDVRAMRRDEGDEISIAVLFVDGELLEGFALREELQLIQIDNVSARLRAVPALPAARKLLPESRVQAA